MTHEFQKGLLQGAIAHAYCHEKNSNKVLDIELAEAICEEIWNLLQSKVWTEIDEELWR